MKGAFSFEESLASLRSLNSLDNGRLSIVSHTLGVV